MFRLNRVLTAAVATVAAVALTACSSSSDAGDSSSAAPSASATTSEEAPSSAAGSSVEESSEESSPAESSDDGGVASSTVSTMFGDVTVDFPADGDLKVVALGWSDAENALALGVKPIAVYDWQGFGAENKGVGPWAVAEFGDVTPEIITNAGDTLNFEAIQALEPDLILNTRSDGDEKTFERLKTIAPTVYAPEGTASFATPWDVQLQQVADALGLGEDGAALVESLQADIDAVATDNPEFAGKTTVAASKFGEAYGAYLAGDGRFDLLASFGFVQNPPVLDIPATGFYAAISAEQIPALDANVAVILPIGFTQAEVLADPLLAALPVVQDGRAIVLEGTSELGGAYSAASALSIPLVLEQLVPQLKESAAKVS